MEADWGDEEAHRRFIGLCDVMGRLDEAGARYRTVREGDPARAEEAGRRIDQVVARALVTLQAERSEPTEGAPRWLLWLAVALSLGVIAFTMWMIRGL